MRSHGDDPATETDGSVDCGTEYEEQHGLLATPSPIARARLVRLRAAIRFLFCLLCTLVVVVAAHRGTWGAAGARASAKVGWWTSMLAQFGVRPPAVGARGVIGGAGTTSSQQISSPSLLPSLLLPPTQSPSPSSRRNLLSPPPSAPFPPMPPWPQTPPVQLLHEPSIASSCGHLLRPVGISERSVLYPGGKWQYFAEWSGLDEQAAAEEKEGYDSYSYGGGVGGVDGRMSSYDDDGDGFSSGRKKAAAAAVRDAAAARAKGAAAKANETLPAAAAEMLAAWVRQVKQAATGEHPSVFTINGDFSLAHGLHRAKMLRSNVVDSTDSTKGNGRRLAMPPTYIPTAAPADTAGSGGGIAASSTSPPSGVRMDDDDGMSYDDVRRRRHGEPSHALRLRLMMANYRGARTLGILENKLLCAT